MSVSGAIRAGAAYVEMLLNDKALVAGLRAAQEKVKAFGASMQTIGKGMMATGGAMLAPFALSTGIFVGFEKSMSRVRALLSLDKQSASFKSLTEEARRLGETTSFSSSDAANAMVELAQSGMDTAQILAATKPLLDLAAAGQVDLATAAKISQEVMHGFRMTAKDTAKIADVLASAARSSATDVQSLGAAFSYVATNAGGLKMSIEETAAAIEMLSNVGVKGSRAGTTLQGMLQSLMMEENAPLLAQLGVRLKDEVGGFVGLASVIKQLNAATSAMGVVDREQTIGKLFTNRQVSGAGALMENPEELVTRTARFKKDEGVAEQMGKDQLDNIWGAWKLIESAIEAVAITIGEELEPVIREWASATIHGIGLLHQVIKENKEWIPIVAKTAVVIGGIGAALLAVGTAAISAGIAWLGIKGAISAASGILSSLFSPAILAVAAGVGLAVAVVSELGITWEGMIPVLKAFGGVALGALAGVVAVGVVTVGVFQKIGTVIAQVLKQIGNAFPSAMKSISEGLSSLAAHFGKLWDDVARAFDIAWGGIVDAIKVGDLKAAGDIAMAGFKLVWKQGELFLLETWRASLKLIVSWWYEAWENIALGMNGIWNGIESALFEGFAAIYRGWGWLMDSMRRQMAGTSSAWSVMAAGFKAGVTFDLNFQNKIEAAATKAQADLKGELDAIKAAREVEIGKELTSRKGIDQRQKAADQKVKDATAASKAAFDTETGKQLFGPRVEVNVAEAELTTLREQIAEALKMKELAAPLEAGFAEAIRVAKQSGTDPKAAFAQAERVAGGGIGAGETAGTFDAAMLRYMGNTSGDSTAKQQLRIAEAQLRETQKLIEIARAAGKTFGS